MSKSAAWPFASEEDLSRFLLFKREIAFGNVELRNIFLTSPVVGSHGTALARWLAAIDEPWPRFFQALLAGDAPGELPLAIEEITPTRGGGRIVVLHDHLMDPLDIELAGRFLPPHELRGRRKWWAAWVLETGSFAPDPAKGLVVRLADPREVELEDDFSGET
jgi:hypothetical protein